MDWVLLAAILIFLIILLVARWPVRVSLGIYALLLPFDAVLIPAKVGNTHLHLTWFVGAGAAGVLLTTALLGRGFVRPPRSALWLTLLVFWAATSSLWAINTERAVFRLPLIALLLLLYLTAVSIRVNKKELATIAWLAILGGCLAAAISIYQFSSGQGFTSVHAAELRDQLSGRGTLWTTNPNYLGATLILPLSLALGQLLSSTSRLRRLLLMGVIALIGGGIYLTMSRGVLLASAVVSMVFFWRSRSRRRMLGAMAVLAIILMAMPTRFFLRLGESLTDRGAGRLDIWMVGLRALKHYGIVGAGLDCFPDAYNEYIHTGLNFVGFSRSPHNIYLATGVELGIVGLVLLLSVIAGHLLLATKVCRATLDEVSRLQVISYEAACWGLLAVGFSLDLLWETYFWLTLMLLVIAVRSWQTSRAAVYLGAGPCREGLVARASTPLPPYSHHIS